MRPAPRLRFGGVPIVAMLSVGCELSAVSVDPSPTIGTVIRASWSADGSLGKTRVEVLDSAGSYLATDWQEPSAAEHAASVLGLASGTGYTLRVAAESGETSVGTPVITADATEVPSLTLTGTPGWGGFLTAGLLGNDALAGILDEQGRFVWWSPANAPVIRARVKQDGTGVWYVESHGEADTDTSDLVGVNWEGEEVSRQTLDRFSHDFVDAPDGRAACVVEDVRENGGKEIVGDSIALVDDEGATETVWDSWDAWPAPQPDEITGTNSWTHANAIDWDPDSQSYWLGMRNQSTILQVFPDGSMGTQIGGADSSYAFPNPEDVPEFQHQFQLVDGGIVMFDDRDSDQYSRVLELSLDDEAGTATAAWTWHHDPEFWVYALGDVDRAADGSTLVVFSSAGTMDDIGPDGELRWELQTQLATGIPYFVRLPELPGVHRIR